MVDYIWLLAIQKYDRSQTNFTLSLKNPCTESLNYVDLLLPNCFPVWDNCSIIYFSWQKRLECIKTCKWHDLCQYYRIYCNSLPDIIGTLDQLSKVSAIILQIWAIYFACYSRATVISSWAIAHSTNFYCFKPCHLKLFRWHWTKIGSPGISKVSPTKVGE